MIKFRNLGWKFGDGPPSTHCSETIVLLAQRRALLKGEGHGTRGSPLSELPDPLSATVVNADGAQHLRCLSMRCPHTPGFPKPNLRISAQLNWIVHKYEAHRHTEPANASTARAVCTIRSSSSMGLRNMRERAAQLPAGYFALDDDFGGGTEAKLTGMSDRA
jgi:hypothetical protein